MLLFVVIFCVVVALGFCLASAWSDWNGMTIPNAYPAGIIITFIIAFAAVSLMGGDVSYFSGIKSHLLSFAAIFGATFVLFSLRLIGAGDSKLAAVVALWTGLQGLLPFLFYMGLTGGILGLLALFLQKTKPVKAAPENSFIDRVQKGENAVPYGIAIAIGAVVAFVQVGYFDTENLSLLAQGGASASE